VKALRQGRLSWLLVLLAACAETSSGTGPSSRPLPEEDELFSMVPAEADLVLWANLARLRSSPWTRDSFERVAGAEGGATASAFGQARSVERLVFAKVPSLGDDASVLVAQGGIERASMLGAFTQDGDTSASTYRGAELATRGAETLAFAGERTALSGPTVAVRAALDCTFGAARAVDTEPWFHRLHGQLLHDSDPTALVAALYVHLQPATREALLREMGEGGALEEFAARVELGDDLRVTALGGVHTAAEARDLAGRLTERLRDASVRPIVAAFGFARALESVQLRAQGNRVVGTLHISARERAEIAERMATVSEMMANMRNQQEKPRP
jgi:hypothetical protein